MIYKCHSHWISGWCNVALSVPFPHAQRSPPILKANSRSVAVRIDGAYFCNAYLCAQNGVSG